MKIVLTIAGTDPSGAAGIQADLQVIRDFGHHGVSVITAVLAQNTQGVQRTEAVHIDLVGAQLASVFDDFEVAAVKVGLVPTSDIARLIQRHTADHLVVWDPVMKSGDGRARLYYGTPQDLWDASEFATLLTPNLPELAGFSGVEISTRADAIRAAIEMARPILLKVGHLRHDAEIRDVLFEDGCAIELAALPAIDLDVRGTGCHLSTAIACGLADGLSLQEAVERARSYLNKRLHAASNIGHGRALITH